MKIAHKLRAKETLTPSHLTMLSKVKKNNVVKEQYLQQSYKQPTKNTRSRRESNLKDLNIFIEAKRKL